MPEPKNPKIDGSAPAGHPSMIGRLWQGVFPFGPDGEALKLAIVDDAGRIVFQGDEVSRAAWKAVLETYWKHLQDLGVMRVHSAPPGRCHSPIGNDASRSKS